MTKSEQMKMYWERKKKALLLTDGNKDDPQLGGNKFNNDSLTNSEIKYVLCIYQWCRPNRV